MKGGATNLDRAIDQILPQITGPLKDEIHQMRREMELGEERADAYHKLTHRNSSEDLRIFVDAILQGDELGTPITETLELQAAELRKRRVIRAREKAAKAGPNISLVTVFLIVPAVLIFFISMMVLAILFSEDFGLLN